jgi:trimeric autotransporter adhesin
MKKAILFFTMMHCILLTMHAQIQTTNYGVSSGTAGNNNSFFGYMTGAAATGGSNSYFGALCGVQTTTGYSNSAIGSVALYHNSSGSQNCVMGSGAMYENTSGNSNVAIGYQSLYRNNTGWGNTAIGMVALYNTNTATGMRNTSVGYQSLYYNTTGSNNTALGTYSGTNSSFPNLQNTTAIGYNTWTTASNQVRIGNIYVTSIGGQVSWSTLSDGRFKRDLKEDVAGLDFINQLRPVSYVIDKNAVDKFLGIPDSLRQQQSEAKSVPARQTGFVAQEVEEVINKAGYVFSGVESPQNNGDHYSIRYGEFVVPIVKAVQELAAIVKEQEKKSEEQQLEISELKQKLGVYEASKSEGNSDGLKVALFQNNPNPFSVDTEIKMTLPETTKQATLIVYNLEGKQLKDVIVKERGNTKAVISGSELAAGMYLYALIADGKVVDTKRLILTK